MGKRVFFAVPLSAEAKQKIKNVLNKCDFSGRFEPEEKWHLTLNFIGSVNDDELAQLVFIGKEAALNFKNFEIKLKRLMYAPLPENPRMLWVEIERSKELEKIKNFIDEKIFKLGIPYHPSHLIYRPHINLIQFSTEDQNNLPQNFEGKIDLKMSVEEFYLMESFLKRPKSRYEILEKYELCAKK